MSIAALFKDEAFGPDDIKAMSAALGDVCKTLDLGDEAKTEKEAVAERIIALAREGERSPAGLRDRVLKEFGNLAAR